MSDPPFADGLGCLLSAGQQSALLAHLDLIAKWTRVYNLTAVRDPREMLTHHLLDCLAVVPPLQRWLAEHPTPGDGAPELLDVGAGAGLPGVTLAIALPDVRVTCVDAVAKKTTFIRQVAAELHLPNLRAEHGRIEALSIPAAQVITSRAFASLVDFTALTRQHLAPGGIWLAMKGQIPEAEIAALPSGVEVFHVEPLVVPGLEAQRCLVWMRPRG
jgi:16S rRNA (guanine527-N7)-methyltransferase